MCVCVCVCVCGGRKGSERQIKGCVNLLIWLGKVPKLCRLAYRRLGSVQFSSVRFKGSHLHEYYSKAVTCVCNAPYRQGKATTTKKKKKERKEKKRKERKSVLYCNAQWRYWSKQMMQNSFWRFSGAPSLRAAAGTERSAHKCHKRPLLPCKCLRVLPLRSQWTR